MTFDKVTVAYATQDRSLFHIRRQLARVLLEHASDGTGGRNLLSQQDMASMLDTGWDMIHLSLKSLCSEGIIRIERNRMIINKKALQEVAEATECTEGKGG